MATFYKLASAPSGVHIKQRAGAGKKFPQLAQDVCDAFEKLEKELREHIEQLQVTKWKRVEAISGM